MRSRTMVALRSASWVAVGATVTSLVIPRSVRAQDCIGCEEDTVPRKTLILPALGARFGVPEKVSGAIGLVAGYEWRSNGHLHTRDFALFVEPGVGASRASLVYMAARNFGSGVGIGATVLRTMDDTWTHGTNAFAFPPSTTLVGGEVLVWPIFLVGPRIGVFHRLNSVPGAGRWFISADFGFGL